MIQGAGRMASVKVDKIRGFFLDFFLGFLAHFLMFSGGIEREHGFEMG